LHHVAGEWSGPGREACGTGPFEDLRDQLAHAGHAVVQAGLVVGSGGNLSARIPGTAECWVTAAGTWLDRLDRSSFVRIRTNDGVPFDLAPETVPDSSGSTAVPGRRPTSELGLHLAIYRTRADVNAIVHLHPQSVLLLDALGERIRLVTTDHAFYVRDIATTPFRPPGSAEVGELAAAACADGTNCVVLAHHGCSVMADSVELAHKRALCLEEAARLTYQALVLGRVPVECPTDWLSADDATS
jgi:ribulose-5-phosphate 4-epimerase/fuculose-1-phosphate aldolase